jgi:hypothetical protein
MNTPLFNTIYSVLIQANLPLSLFCFVMAAFQLRAEGGVNYDANGGFFKWMAWGALMLTLQQAIRWLGSEGISAATNLGGMSTASQPYASAIIKVLTDFVNVILVQKLVPVMAGALVLKALLDTSEGRTPIPSIISAMFLLGISGFFTTVELMEQSDNFATTELLSSILNWAMTQVCPIFGVLSIYGGIIQYVRGKDWLTSGITGIAFLSISGIWQMVQSWVGVNIS